jgi:hypothetical protein
MTAARFSRVLRGQRTPAARQKYLDYLAGLNAQEDRTGGTTKNRPATVPLFVHPFSLKYDANDFVRASCLQNAYDTMGSVAAVAAHLSTVAEATGAGKTQVRLARFKAARANRTLQTGTTGNYTKSKLTGLWYAKYSKSSMSIPFGRGAANDVEGDVFADIAAAVKGANNAITMQHIEEEL